MLKVAVLGALGRMGREVTRAVVADEQLELVVAVDPAGPRTAEEPYGIPVMGHISYLDGMDVDVMVDFTEAPSAVANILWALEHDIDCVVGTSGLGAEDLERISERATAGKANVLIASNFAIGAVIMMQFAENAARVFDQCDIVELHHRGNKDSPSGTAIETARLIEAAM